MKIKEYELISKKEVIELLKEFNGVLMEKISTDAGQVYYLSNKRVIVTSDYETKSYYYFNDSKFNKNEVLDNEVSANKEFFENFLENRNLVIKYIDSLYPTEDFDTFYKDTNSKRQNDFLHKVLLKEKDYIAFRNAFVYIGEILNYNNGFEWRIEQRKKMLGDEEISLPYIYNPKKDEKVFTHYFKQILEYNNGDRKKIYL